jgi:hypothetical protein
MAKRKVGGIGDAVKQHRQELAELSSTGRKGPKPPLVHKTRKAPLGRDKVILPDGGILTTLNSYGKYSTKLNPRGGNE